MPIHNNLLPLDQVIYHKNFSQTTDLQKDTALLGPPKALKDQPSRDYFVSTSNKLSNLLLPEFSLIYQFRKEFTDSKSQSCVSLTKIRFQSAVHHAQIWGFSFCSYTSRQFLSHLGANITQLTCNAETEMSLHTIKVLYLSHPLRSNEDTSYIT